jgi:hypothetical protein
MVNGGKALVKNAVLVVALFLGVALIFSSSYIFDAFGEIKRSSIDCIGNSKTSNIWYCCYEETDTDTGNSVGIYCATCYDDGTGNLACGAYDKVESIKPPDGGEVFPKDTAPPPSGVAPPPSTETCPENTALDANGNCAPSTQGPSTEPPSSDDNKPSRPELPKGGDILGLQPTD